METKAHQKPSQAPLKKEVGNWSGFQYESYGKLEMVHFINMNELEM